VRRALAQGEAEETLREALARLTKGDEADPRHGQKQERYRQYLETRAQHREAVVGETMDEVDRERQRTGYAWPDRETRFAARRDAGLQAEGEFELAEPRLEFADWVEAGEPERYRAEGPVARRRARSGDSALTLPDGQDQRAWLRHGAPASAQALGSAGGAGWRGLCSLRSADPARYAVGS